MSIVLSYPVPTKGLNTNQEPTAFSDAFSPYMKNVYVDLTKVRKRRGISQIGSTSLPLTGTGMKLVTYTDARGSRHELAFTTTNIYEYNGSTKLWVDISPNLQLDDGEDDWIDGAGANSADSVANPPGDEPANDAIFIDCVADVADGDLLAYIALGSATDVSQYNTIKLWVYPVSTGLSANSLEVVITEEVNGAKGGVEVIKAVHDAAPADTWTLLSFTVDLSAIDGAQSIAVYANHATEFDALDLYIDDFRTTTTFTGGASNLWTHSLATDTTEFSNNGGTALVVCNGVDDIQYYEGDSDDVFKVLVHDSGIVNTDIIAEFWNHLMYFNFNDGLQNIKSLLYSAAGNIDDHVSSTAGAHRLTDTIGEILAVLKLGSTLIIYSEKTITVCRYYGGETLFSFPTLIYGTGAVSANAVLGLVNTHFLLGTDSKVYIFYGDTHMVPVGEQIEDTLFAELDISKKKHIVTGLDATKYKVHFFIPGSGGDYANTSYCYNYRQSRMSWEYHDFSKTIKGFGSVLAGFDWYCDEDPMQDIYCDETSVYCDDSSGQTGYETPAFISDAGYVYQLDEVTGLDDDEDIAFELHTPEFIVAGEEVIARWVWFSCQLYSSVVSSTANVWYSIDSGDSWVEIDDSPVSINQVWTTHRLPIDVTSRRIRFKFVQVSDKDIQIRGLFKCAFEPSSVID